MSGRRDRSAGVLLHPTSLPGPFGIGDLGPEAYRFADFLAEAGMRRWQILPLGPPGYGGSPYNAESSFAGNELLISPSLLGEDGLLDERDLTAFTGPSAGQVDFVEVIESKGRLLRQAYERYRQGSASAPLDEFRRDAADWLEDFALYRALKRHHGGGSWETWERALRLRDPGAMERARRDLAEEIDYECWVQWVFERQWSELRAHARSRDILVIGDIPMFPAYDSADVWANQHLFKLDKDGKPSVLAGVPPDYFSETGQLWGNPHYDWPRHAADGYSWWRERFRWTFDRADIIRIDHFRGFQAAWEVPAGAETAVDGEWVEGPGVGFFRELDLLSHPVIIAEDLGTIAEPVHILLDETGFPGMKVLQFAFGSGPDNEYLPHNHRTNAVAYTGTHDNDTLVGWLNSLDAATASHVRDYFGLAAGDLADALIRATFASVAETAIIPMQDVLLLGAEARMNTPSEAHGSWGWRFGWEQLAAGRAVWLRSLVDLYGRLPRRESDDNDTIER